MGAEKIGAGLSEVQIDKLKTIITDENRLKELTDLFDEGEDQGEKGFMDDVLALGFSEAEITALSEDEVIKGILDGTIDPKAAVEAGAVDAAAADGAVDGADAPAAEGEAAADGADAAAGDAAALKDEISALKAEIGKIDADIEGKIAERDAKEKELETAKEKQKNEEAELAKLQKEYETNKKEYDEIQEAIKEATKNLEEDVKDKQQEAIYKAMSEYDEARDGDWDKYIQGKLEGVVESSALSAVVENLSSKETTLLKNLGNLQLRMNAQEVAVKKAGATVSNLQGELTTLNDDIAALETTKKGKEAELSTKEADLKKLEAPAAAAAGGGVATKNPDAYKSGTTPVGEDKLVEDKKLADLKALVSEEEFALVEEMGVDLYEKLENGEPRYIFAPGAQDGKYHIYDMSGNLTSAGDNSLVRLHYGYTEESYSIIECGNGGITPGTWNKLGTGESSSSAPSSSSSDCPESSCNTPTTGGREVFYLDDCSTVKTFNACYQTWSPLSLDLNGDGVQTSDRVVDFDIDGDGILDKINDSADGVLVFDKDGDGISGGDGSECFGDGTDLDGDGVKDGYKDGFEALKALAEKEGLINGADDMVLDSDDIKYLEEKMGFGIKAGGYLDKTQSLSDLGITEINLAKTDETTLEDNFDGKGNQLMTQEGATFVQNGETKEYADIWHKKIETDDVKDTPAKSDVKAETAEPKAKESKGGSNLTFKLADDTPKENVWEEILQEKLQNNAHKSGKKDYTVDISDLDIRKPKQKEEKDDKDE